MKTLSNIWRLPLAGLNLLLTTASGAFQGFGLLLFVPLLKMMGGSPDELTFPFGLLRNLFAFLGIPFELPYLLTSIVIVLIFGLALNFAQRSTLMAVSMVRFVRQTSDEFVDAVLKSGWSHLSTLSTGEITNQLITEIQRSGRAMSHLLISVANIIQVIIFVVISAALSWQLLLVAIGFSAVAFLIVRPLQHHAVNYGNQLTVAKQSFGFHAVDYLQNLKLIKVTGSEARTRRHINQLQADVCNVVGKRQINLALTYLVTQVLPVLLVAAIIATSATIMKTETTVVLVFLLFLARMAPLMSQFQQEFQAFIMEAPAIRLVDDLLKMHRSAAEPLSAQAVDFGTLGTNIRLRGVSYQFPNSDTAAVDNIDLDIRPGEMVALVGGSGAGKSTMIDLICGLRNPTAGQILVGDRNLKTIDLLYWRQRIGYVTQDIAVFNDTVRNNITLSRPGISEQDIGEAIAIAQLDNVIGDLPDGLDTIMGEGGVRLSGGQKQRLALARALAANPALLLLDEATSSLDNESERLIQNAIDEVAHRFTTVVIAHRLSTVRKAKRIYVLEAGRIVESGTYDQLVAAKGRFSELHQFQFDKVGSTQ